MKIGCSGTLFIVVLVVFLIPGKEDDDDFSSLRTEDPPAWEMDTNWRPKPKNIKSQPSTDTLEAAIEEVIDNQEYYLE